LDQDELIREGLDQKNIEFIQQEILSFSEIQRKILKYAALFKSPFDYRLLAASSAISKINVLKELKKLVDKKYFVPDTKSTYHFKNNEIKSILSKQIPPSDQLCLHLAIANQIAEQGFFSNAEKNFLLAYHYSRSSEKYRAYPFLIEAADIALKNFAFLEAHDLYRQAINLEFTEPRQKQRLHVLMQAAWLNRVLGFYGQSIKNCKMALSVHGKTAQDRTTSLIRIQMGFTYFRLNKWQVAQTNFLYCLERIDMLQSFEKSMVLYGLGNISFELGNYDEAQQSYDKALHFANESQDKSLIALILNNLGAVANVMGNTLKAIALYSQAIPLYKQTHDDSGLAKIYNNIGITYSDENDWEQANQFFGKSLSVTGMMGLAPLKSITFLNRALALTHLDEIKEAREYSFKAIRLLENLNDKLGVAEYYKIQGIIEAKDQNWDASDRQFIKAAEIFRKFSNELGYAETLLEWGISVLYRKRNDDAIKLIRKAHRLFTEMNVAKKATIAFDYLNKIGQKELVGNQ